MKKARNQPIGRKVNRPSRETIRSKEVQQSKQTKQCSIEAFKQPSSQGVPSSNPTLALPPDNLNIDKKIEKYMEDLTSL